MFKVFNVTIFKNIIAIGSILYFVIQPLEFFENPSELGMEDTLAQLQVLDGDQVATACRTTLNILVQNAMENVENKIFEVLDIIAEKVCISCMKEKNIICIKVRFQFQSSIFITLYVTDGPCHTEIFD